MTFDTEVVVTRLGLMRELLRDLDAAGQVDARRLGTDRLTRHAVERILTQLVDLAVSINSHAAISAGVAPNSYRDSFRAAADAGLISLELAERLAPSAGLRNVLTHEYVDIDLDLVAGAADAAKSDYGEYVRTVAQSLS